MKRTPASAVARRMSDAHVMRAVRRLNIYERDLATFIVLEAQRRGLPTERADA